MLVLVTEEQPVPCSAYRFATLFVRAGDAFTDAGVCRCLMHSVGPLSVCHCLS